MDRPYDIDEQASRGHREDPQDFDSNDEASGGGPSTMDREQEQYIRNHPTPFPMMHYVRNEDEERELLQRLKEKYP